MASIEFVGNYSAGNFHITSGHGGIVEITDPTVPNGGSIDTRTADASALHSGIDLPNIAFDAQTTLAYTEDNAETGGTLTVANSRHAAPCASRRLHGRNSPLRPTGWRHATHAGAAIGTAAAVDASNP